MPPSTILELGAGSEGLAGFSENRKRDREKDGERKGGEKTYKQVTSKSKA